jgi:hypothetical protein
MTAPNKHTGTFCATANTLSCVAAYTVVAVVSGLRASGRTGPDRDVRVVHIYDDDDHFARTALRDDR